MKVAGAPITLISGPAATGPATDPAAAAIRTVVKPSVLRPGKSERLQKDITALTIITARPCSAAEPTTPVQLPAAPARRPRDAAKAAKTTPSVAGSPMIRFTRPVRMPASPTTP
jgi:hypothetical protein